MRSKNTRGKHRKSSRGRHGKTLKRNSAATQHPTRRSPRLQRSTRLGLENLEARCMLFGPDAFGYQAEAVPFEFEDISTSGTAELVDVDDAFFNLTAAELSGFQFEFYGANYTTGIYASSNGLITFQSGNPDFTNQNLASSPFQAAIAPFWDDLVTFNGGAVYWQVLGAGADQRLVIQWDDVFYIGGAITNPITFQAVLHERTGDIQFNYADLADSSTSQNEGASATVGIKDVGAQGGNRLVPSFNSGPNPFVGTGLSTRFASRQPIVFGLDVVSNDIVQINSDTGQIIDRFSAPTSSAFNDAVAFSDDRIFVYGSSGSGGLLREYNSAGVLVDFLSPSSVGLPGTMDGLALFDGLLVASDSSTGHVYFVDTATDTLVRSWTAPVTLGEGLTGAGERGSLFVADSSADTITELDADSGAVVRVLNLAMTGPVGLAYVESELVVSGPFGDLRRVNPDSGEVLGAVTTGLQLSALGGDDSSAPAPRVISSSIANGDTVGPGTVVYTAQFSRPLNAGALDVSDVRLVGASTGERQVQSLNYNPLTRTLTLTLGSLFEDQYTLTLLSDTDAFVGAGGRPLDGESSPGSSLPSGNRLEGGDFTVQFSGDISTAAIPAPFSPVAPLGGQVYSYAVHGSLHTANDADVFRFNIDPGQYVTLVLEGAEGATMVLSPSGGGGTGGGFLVEGVAPLLIGATSAVQTYPGLAGGDYRITLSGAGVASGDYTLTIILNADVELPGGNDSADLAQPLEDGFLTQGSGAQRGAVLGSLDTPTGVLFFDDFPSAAFSPARWSAVQNATIDSLGLNEPSAPLSARLNGSPNGGDRIETVAIDLSSAVDPVLAYSFQQGGGGEQPDTGDDLVIAYLNQSGAWVEINRHAGSTPATTEFERVEIPLPTDARHAGFKLRISSTGSASSTNIFDDWFVDDVSITHTPSEEDWYHFVLSDGQTASIALASDAPAGANVTLELYAGESSLEGDFNNDGVVDAADYTVWRDHLASGEPLLNDPTPGSVTQDDYLVWRNNFGATLAVGATLTRIATGTPDEIGGQVISGLLDQTADGLPGNYFLRVLGDPSAYSLLVTRDAEFDSRASAAAGLPQDISLSGAVFGRLESVENNRLYTFDATADLIRELDPQTGAQLNAFPTPVAHTSSPDFGLATTPTSLLVGGTAFGDIYELHPDTGEVIRTIDNPGVEISGIAFLNNLVFLLDDVASTLTVLLYSTGDVLRTVPVGNVSESLASDGVSLFGTLGSQLYRISPITGATFLVGALNNTASNIEGLGFIGDELYAADFDKIDVYQYPSLNYSRSITGLQNLEAIGADKNGPVVVNDTFSLSVLSGDQLQLVATAAASGSGEFSNNARLRLELLDPSGVLVASGSNPGANPDATVSYTALATGLYTINVSSELTAGEYLLEAFGATGGPAPFQVAAALPANEIITESPEFIEIAFNDQIDLASLDASDLLIDGAPAAAIQMLVDGRTVRFETPLLLHGSHTLAIAEGSIVDLQGTPLDAYASGFEIDSIGPQVVFSSLTEGQIVQSNAAPGRVDVVIGFNEALDESLLGALSVLDNVLLEGQRSGSYSVDTFEYDPATYTLQLSFADLVEDRYTLTLLSNNALFADPFGNPLDGEPHPLTTVPSGDDESGGDFFVGFELDSPTHSPADFVRLQPLGGLASVSENTRRLNSASDIDAYSIFAQQGETLTAILTPSSPTVTLRAQLVGQTAEVVAPAPGAPLVVPIRSLPADGNYTLRVRGDGVSDYTTMIYHNTAVEAAVGDSGDGNELSLDSSFVPLGSGRYAVVGASEDNHIDRVVWAAQPATGLILRIDPATGEVLGGFAAPGELLPSHTNIGLTIAEFGEVLLYMNADEDPTTLYRLNPSTGEVLSVEFVHASSVDGLAYNSFRSPSVELLVNGGFETGDFSGWTAATNGLLDFTPWTVAGDGQGFFNSSAPLTGDFSAMNGFVGEDGLVYQLYQDVTIPAGVSAILSTNHRIQYDSLGSTSLIDRDLAITIRDLNNNILDTLYTESLLTDSAEPYTDLGWNHQTFDVSAYAGQTVRIHFNELITDFFVAPSLIQFDDISLQVSTQGSEEAIFLSHGNADIHRQAGYSGAETTFWATGRPLGALGGDDVIRQFGYFADGLIHEYAPDVDENSFLSTLPSPAANLEGMAFDGATLYVSPQTGGLIHLDPETGAVLQTQELAGGAFYGLGALTFSGPGIITPNFDEYEITLQTGPDALYDFVLAGQNGVDFSGSLIEVLDGAGTVVATSSSHPLGVNPGNLDQAILGFTPAEDGVYTIRLTLDAVGQYGLVVTEGVVFEAEPNDVATTGFDPLRSITPTVPGIGYLEANQGFTQVFPLVRSWPYSDASSEHTTAAPTGGYTATLADAAYLPVGVSREDLARKLNPPTPRIASLGDPVSLIVAGETEPNDSLATANDLALGFEIGEDPAVDVSGSLSSVADVDVFRLRLQPGDILGAGVSGGASELGLFDASGNLLMGSAQDLTGIYPVSSPLPGGGNAALSWVVDTAGEYYMAVGNGLGGYNLNLRLFRPVLEQQPFGSRQTLFIDFDGATLNAGIFGGSGTVTLSGLDTYLPGWGLTTANRDAVIDAILASIEESLSADIRERGPNGDFGDTALPGQFDIEILNSRDHVDPFGLPNVSRVIVGGSIAQLGISTIGIAESIDVGNFETEESAVVLLDLLSSPAGDPNSLNTFARAPGVSIIDLIGVGVGNIVSHEAGHFFGNWHTNQFNVPPSIMDQGGNLSNTVGLQGGVWGDGNETDVDFGVDEFVANEGFAGFQNSMSTIAFGLSTSGADPALVGPRVRETFPSAGLVEEFDVRELTITFSEQVTTASALDPANYLLLAPGANGLFEGGGGDDFVIPVTPSLDASGTVVSLAIGPPSALPVGQYQLTIDGDNSIEDPDGNPLGSITGPGGGFDYVLDFEIGFDPVPGADIYAVNVPSGYNLTLWTETLFDNPLGTPLNTLDTRLVLVDPNGVPVANDSDSLDGKNALLQYTGGLSGLFKVYVFAEEGAGEYLLQSDLTLSNNFIVAGLGQDGGSLDGVGLAAYAPATTRSAPTTRLAWRDEPATSAPSLNPLIQDELLDAALAEFEAIQIEPLVASEPSGADWEVAWEDEDAFAIAWS